MKPIFLFLFLLATIATSLAQENLPQVGYSGEDESLQVIIHTIEQQTGYSFAYNETIRLDRKKSLRFENLPLKDALNRIFEKTGIQWTIKGKHIILQNAGRKATVSGYIIDSRTGETLIGANIYESINKRGTLSNNYGYFTFSHTNESTSLEISYVGYQTQVLELIPGKDSLVRIYMEPAGYLPEVLVTENAKPFTSASGFIELSREQIKNTPAVFGETDVLKTIQLLPGVQAAVEGTSGIYVRGGGADQNLILLDGVNVYNTSHFYGIFSIFNGDAVKKVSLHKGSFPARFGGRLSSVVDIRLKDGDMKNFHGSVGIGLLSATLNLEGPIVKDRTSFNISARRSYADAFLRAAKLITGETVPIIYFYDLNLKMNHKFNDKSRLYLSLYNGKDLMGAKTEASSYYNYGGYGGYNYRDINDMHFYWGNTVGSLRWNYVFNPQLFMNATLAYNNYKFDFRSKNSFNDYVTKNESYSLTYQNSGIRDFSANLDFEYFSNTKHHIRFGGGIISHTFKPEIHGSKEYIKEDGNEDSKEITFLSEKIDANETSLYIEDEISLNDHWKTNIGAHFSTFTVDGKFYHSIQPRLALGYEFNRNLSFKTSYSEMSQYIHLLTNNSLSNPTDLWVPSTPQLEPMESQQYSLGAYYDWRNGYQVSIEGFYKKMNNLLEYKEGALWGSANKPWYEQVESGKGRTYGVELFAQKTQGKLTGWIGYTLAWNFRKFPTINQGKEYPAKYDRRHDIKLNLSYKINDRWDVFGIWTYASGNTFSLPLNEYPSIKGLDPQSHSNKYYYGYADHYWLEEYGERNNYRIDAFHHLDIGVNYYRKKNEKGRQGVWNFTIFNVYNNHCPFFVYPDISEKTGRRVLSQISLFPFLPSFTYTYKF